MPTLHNFVANDFIVHNSTYARCGIICNVTPLEPEWEGHVTLEFSNTTPLPAKIYANEGVAQMLFFESDEVCETSYKDRGGKYQGQRGVTLAEDLNGRRDAALSRPRLGGGALNLAGVRTQRFSDLDPHRELELAVAACARPARARNPSPGANHMRSTRLSVAAAPARDDRPCRAMPIAVCSFAVPSRVYRKSFI